MADYADYHFSTEEAIWEPCYQGDAWYIEHQKTHQSFLDQASQLRDEIQTETPQKVIEDTLGFLIKWLAFHILDADKRMAIALQAVKGGASLEETKAEADIQMSGSTRTFIQTILTMYEKMSSRTIALINERNNSKKAAETANAAKSDFLSSMSHELRTPLNAIVGFSQLLEQDPMLDDRQKSNVRVIYKAGKHLVSMINEILNLAKIEAGRIDLEMESVLLKSIVD